MVDVYTNLSFGNIANDQNAGGVGLDVDPLGLNKWAPVRWEGTILYRTTDAAATDAVVIYAPGILSSSGKPVIANLTVRALAHKLDGTVAGSWHRGFTGKWDGFGAFTAVGVPYDIAAEQGSSGCAFTFDGASGGMVIRATGLAATDIDWLFFYSFIAMDFIVA